uniref:Secreted protein n=1 Tax=Heterorhabditis bacteriophora TaxID=37862 RepID=A0A1I7WG25_HETBA
MSLCKILCFPNLIQSLFAEGVECILNLSTFSVGKINVALISTDILTVGTSVVVCISSSAFSLEIVSKLVIGQDLLSKLHQVGPFISLTPSSACVRWVYNET